MIKDGTFYYNSISSIVIPSSVVTIGDSAFDSNSLDSITIEGNEFRFNSNWTAIGFPYDLMPVQNE